MYELPKFISDIVDKLELYRNSMTEFDPEEIDYMIIGLKETYKIWNASKSPKEAH